MSRDAGPPPPGGPLGLDRQAQRALLCPACAVLHLLFLAALLLPGALDRRWLAAGVLAAVPAAACLLFDAYAFAGGPS